MTRINGAANMMAMCMCSPCMRMVSHVSDPFSMLR